MYLVITMRTAIVYESFHHGNTLKLAEAMAQALGADLIRLRDRSKGDLRDYDLVGLGSGIYGSRHHRELLAFAGRARFRRGAEVFIFSTAGFPPLSRYWHRALRAALEAREVPIVGELCLAGYDTYAIFGLLGGVNRGRPSDRDLERGVEFARSMIDAR